MKKITHSSFLILFYSLLFICQLSFSQSYTVGESYYGTSEEYIEYIPGNLPIIIVQPHDGQLESTDTGIPIQNEGRAQDNYTSESTALLVQLIKEKTNGGQPHLIINHLHPNLLNPARIKAEATGTNEDTQQAWEDFHTFMEISKAKLIADWGTGHYFEMHGNGVEDKWSMIGLGFHNDVLDLSDTEIVFEAKFNYQSTIHLLSNTLSDTEIIDSVKGPNSLGGYLNAKGWKSAPSVQYPKPNDREGDIFYRAGWNTWEHAQERYLKVDATHIENYWEFMSSSNRDNYVNDLADGIINYMETFYRFNLDSKAFRPDPNKTYYIDVPIHNKRIAANGESDEVYTVSTGTTGEDVEWKFIAKGDGSWHIQRAAGGSLPRLRTDNSDYADMISSSYTGSYTYYSFEEGFMSNTYFITLTDGPTDHKRLQVNAAGEVKMVSTASNRTWESFIFTEVTPPSESCTLGTNLALNGLIADYSDQRSSTYAAANIIDGNETTGYWTAGALSEGGFSHYVVVDLGADYSINEIELVTYDNRDYQFIVEGSITSATAGFNTLVDALANTSSGPITKSFATETARYVKLTITGADDYEGAYCTIREFKIICAGSTNKALKIEAEDFDDMFQIQTEVTIDENGGKNVGYIDNGDWLRFDDVNLSGITNMDARIACNFTGGTVEVRTGSVTGTLVGSIDVRNTGGNQNWVTLSTSISNASGTQDVYLVFTGGNGFLFNINWVEFNTSSRSNKDIEAVTSINYTVYPNPVLEGSEVTIDSDSNVKIAQLYDMSGRIVKDALLNDNKMIINTAVPGLYLLHILFEDGSIKLEKLVVE